jgi:hypothetical protein
MMTTSWHQQLPSLVLNTRADDYAVWLDFWLAFLSNIQGHWLKPQPFLHHSFTLIHPRKKSQFDIIALNQPVAL